MQIVIEIPDRIWQTGLIDVYLKSMRPYDLIRSGIPLPKGHGRLIDADIGKEVMLSEMCGTGYQSMAVSFR